MAQIFPMRSWLFAPADSARKIDKAVASAADIVILDLEDSVAPDAKPAARGLVGEVLGAADLAARRRLWVRINPLDSGQALADLVAVMASAPGGILLPKSAGADDVTTLHHYLSAMEAAHGLTAGSTRIAALVTETPGAMFTAGSYGATGDWPGKERLAALSWGAEDLGSALGTRQRIGPDGRYAPVFELARSLCLLGAASAGVAAIETIMADFRDLAGLAARAAYVRGQGYAGMLAIHPDQVPVINDAFTPSEAELAEAQEIVSLFAANPGAGTIGHKGAMLDRPHLVQAQKLLAAAGESDKTG